MLESDRIIYQKLTPDDLPWLIEMRSPEPVNRYLGGSKMQNPESLATRLNFISIVTTISDSACVR